MSTRPGAGGHDTFSEDAAAYVLGALADDEHGRFAAHLQGCAACREEVARLQVVVDALPLAAPQLGAPPELKRRIMGAVAGQATGQAPGDAAPREPAAASRHAGSRAPRRSGWRSPRRWALGGVGALAAVAAALALVSLATSGGGAGPRVVRAQVLARGASASLRINGGRAELVLDGMPQVPPRRTYQVWVQRRGAPQPTDALFSVSSSGGATVAVPGNIAGVSAVLVTAEPLGGSRTPTSSPVIVARL
ncbi:MAG TPA: anti-sigma factor [Solirubrobacteraceae bacterium]|nr:anti-sigma factor [Solirubrobacteraceae bacterium]